jgi:amino acid adenylation domain-containing protein
MTTIPTNGAEQDAQQSAFLLPASFGQRRLWFLDQLAPSTPVYNLPGVVRIAGCLDVEVLRRTLQEVSRRHESLRTCFRAIKGEPQQVIVQATAFELSILDLSSDPRQQERADIQRCVQEFIDTPFDLKMTPLWRVKLFRVAENDYIAAIVMHHIISDGWSQAILWREISLLYTAFACGKPSPLPELAVQYADFSEWQRELLQGKVMEEQLAYWKTQLAGMSPLNLPYDRPRSPAPQGKGSLLTFRVERTVSERLLSLSRQHAASLYMTLLAAFQILLFRYTQQRDILVAAAVAGRTRPEIEEVIGFFINTLILRTKLSGEWNFHKLLQKVKETTLGAYDHQELPFELLVQELSPERETQGSIIQVTFTLQNMPSYKLHLGETEILPFEFETTTAKFDLTVSLSETGGGVFLGVYYDSELFDPGTIAGMFQHYVVLLQSIAEEPEQKLSELRLISKGEEQALLAGWAAPALEAAGATTICTHVKEWAQRTPDAAAMLSDDRKVTYRQLNQRANQLAHYLRTIGIKPEDRVGVGIEKPEKLLVLMLGIMKAGAVFVPLSLEDPALRARGVAASSCMALVISETGWAERWSTLEMPLLNLDLHEAQLAVQSVQEPDVRLDAWSQACVLYRSASADKPEGVLIHHGALCNRRFGTEIDIHTSDRVAQNLSFSYELSPFGIFSTLQAGACIVPVRTNPVPMPLELAELVQRSSATVIFMWAAMLADLSRQAPWVLSQFRLLFCGDRFEAWQGLRENLSPEVLSRVHWLYGSTEISGWLFATRIAQLDVPMEIAPVEQILQGAKLYLLDEEMEPVPDGAVGELYVSTPGMAMGYEGQPARTAENFLSDVFSDHAGQRLYRTGEKCRRRADAHLQFCGRQDKRTRIQEVRVEPGEIEALLLQHRTVQEAAVLAYKQPGRKEYGLVAFIVAATEQLWNLDELRQYLSERLPEAMLPTDYVRLDALPMTFEGEVDLVALAKRAERGDEASGGIPAYLEPRDAIEKQLVEIWARTFQVEQVGVHDSFFRLGGHSLFATIMVAQIIDVFNVDLPVRLLFEAPTIARLAKVIEQRIVEKDAEPEEVSLPPILVEIQSKGTAAPFFCVHPIGGHVFCYGELAKALGEEQPFYGLQAPAPGQNDLSLATVEEIARLYLQQIRSVQPKGPYFLGGWSLGGVIAWQLAEQMKLEGEAVSMLVLMDTKLPPKNLASGELEEMPLLTWFAIDLCQLLGKDLRQFSEQFLQLDARGQFGMILSELQHEGLLPQDPVRAEKQLRDFYDVFQRHAGAVREYQLTPMQQEIVVFEAGDGDSGGQLGKQWAAWSRGVKTYMIPGNHYTILRRPNVSILADHLRSCLQDARNEAQRPILHSM